MLSPPHTCHNVIVNDVDDSNDLFESSKEEVISILTKEVDEDVDAYQTITTTSNSKIVSSEPIATTDNSETEPRNHVAIEKYQI